MHGARAVSGKILSVTTDPGDSIEEENFSRAGDRCSQCCKFFEKYFFLDCEQSAAIWTIGRLEDIWRRDLRHGTNSGQWPPDEVKNRRKSRIR